MRRLTRYLEGQRVRLAMMVIVASGNAACQTGGWLLVRDAIDHGIVARDEQRLTIVVAAYLGVAAAGWVLQLMLIRGLARIGQRIVLGLRRDLFDHLTGLSLRYFSSQKAGWIIARLTSDVDAVSDTLAEGMPVLLSNAVLLPFAVVALIFADWRLGLVVLAIVPPALALSRWFQRTSTVALVETRNRIAAVTAQIAESVAGMAVVQAFRREQAFQAQFDELNAANYEQGVYAQRLFATFFPAIEFLGVLATVAVLYAGERLLAHHTLTIGTLIVALYLLQLCFQPLQALSDVYGQLQAAAAAMVKIGTILDEEPEIREQPSARELPRIAGELELDRVSFAYGAEPVLCEVEIRVPAGGCLALVGESGGGKSTLARLVGRFYDPDSGTVRVDGTDLRTVKLDSYRRQMGVVLQDPFLFSGTIASNIRFAKPDASDEDVARVAAAVGVDRVAARLRGGLEHEVREGGSGLSAGERQLISIARALLADPRILILDEATSNIDRPTEVLVEAALDRLLRGRTSIIVAHRLSTVRRADEIVVLEHGSVVQRGSERELLAVDGPFRALAHGLVGDEGVAARAQRARARGGGSIGSGLGVGPAHEQQEATLPAKGTAEWKGDLQTGAGTFTAGDTISGDYSFKSRFEDGPGANPEQLIAAAHASCFSMALANMLAQNGTAAESIRTDATVTLRRVDDAPTITKIELVTVGRVPGLSEEDFQTHAAAAKAGCPVSRALASVPEITLAASLAG